MGRIVIAYKIFPSESTIDLKLLKEKIKTELSDIASVQQFAEEPIAFGLCALIVNMVLPEDIEGILDKAEKRLTDMEEISQIQTIGINRL
jgi:elongation factor 1-beta